jgi:hypothetical protein
LLEMIGLHPDIQTPERLSLTCALGLRFFDVATGAFVTADSLQASAWPVDVPWQAIDGIVTPSGIVAFHGLPGLRESERSDADDPWSPAPATRMFQVEATDPSGRYLPCTFVVQAPTKGLAIFAESGSPPWTKEGAVPLFSMPSRAVPPGLAIVRAELRELATGQPAAWAFVEAQYSSGGVPQTAYGLADDQGRLVLMFPYPEGQRRPLGGSPPTNGANGLTQQYWELDLMFFYQPLAASPPSTSEPEDAADYALRLAQPQVSASCETSPLAPLDQVNLYFVQELNLGIIDLAPAFAPLCFCLTNNSTKGKPNHA